MPRREGDRSACLRPAVLSHGTQAENQRPGNDLLRSRLQADGAIPMNTTRRNFLSGAGLCVSTLMRQGRSATSKGPNDFIIVEGHRDIWELSGRTRIKEEAQRWPLT